MTTRRTEPAQWEIIYRILQAKFEEQFKNQRAFSCFNTNYKMVYNKREIDLLSEANNEAFARFSNLVHQMPTSVEFEVSGKLLWEAYQKLFYTTIPKHQSFYKTVEVVADSSFKKKEKKYKKYQQKEELLENQMIHELNAGNKKEIITDLKIALRKNLIDWKIKGYKDEVERLYNAYLAKSNFSNAGLWISRKEKATDADRPRFDDPTKKFGDCTIDFSELKSRRWRKHTIRHKALRQLIQSSKKVSEQENVSKLIHNIDKIKFEYCIVNVKRDWFEPAVFESDCWRWHPNYDGQLLSNGRLGGSLPSYITDVVFVRNIRYRQRSNFMFDLLEWLGGFFTELPMQTFISNYADEQFLVGFLCQKVPPSP